MKNPFRVLKDQNPLPDAAIQCHDDMWKVIGHLRQGLALTDERVLFVMKYMFPFTWSVLFLILATIIATAVAIILSR